MTHTSNRKMSVIRQLSLSWKFRILLFIWLTSTLFFILKFASSSTNQEDIALTTRLQQTVDYIAKQEQINSDLRNLVDEYISDASFSKDKKNKFVENVNHRLQISKTVKNNEGEPNSEYEHLRRRVKTNIQEFWNYVESESKHFKGATDGSLKDFLQQASDHRMSLLNDMDELKKVDGFDAWRSQEAKDLSDLVQKRLHYLQNPDNCQNARKIVCRLNKGCGYGCQLHHVVYCFIMAYATERTLILKSKGWRYHKAGWEEVFEPVSKKCTDALGETHSSWPGSHDTQVITLPIIDSLNPRPKYIPLAIPADLAPRLKRIHGDPFVWWVGQFLKYLLRPTEKTKDFLDNSIQKLNFQKPIVGVHVRRTDKVGTEAAFHSLDEYMKYVDEYFDQLELVTPVSKRRVFIASDDPKVIEEAKQKYKNYDVIGDPDIAKVAAVSTRYTDSSLNGIILDIHLLSLSDYLVCTFSSQVCRVAYEIMQTMYPDASDRFKSLDDIYYYGGQNSHYRQAILPHNSKKPDQINLRVGDLVSMAGNHWNGYSKGKNERTHQVGLFPSFKVVDKVEAEEFPTYNHVQ